MKRILLTGDDGYNSIGTRHWSIGSKTNTILPSPERRPSSPGGSYARPRWTACRRPNWWSWRKKYDAYAMNAGYISVTPCQLDLLKEKIYSKLQRLSFSL